MVSEVERPVLRYHGGKWALGGWIISHFPDHRIYVEPFGGAASVLLQKPQSYAEVYNDLNGDVVTLFEVLRDERKASELIEQVRLTPWARQEFEGAYDPTSDPIERARRLLVRSWMGHTGGVNPEHSTGFRAHATKRGSTPAMDWASLPPRLRAVVERLQKVIVEQRDALEVIRQQDTPQTLHYVDPPYPHESRETPGVYRHEYTEDDHRDLATVLHDVDGMVVLSGYDCPLLQSLYGDWTRYTRESVTSSNNGGRYKTESLWVSPSADKNTLFSHA